MNHQSKFLWISASPSLNQLHRRLLNTLSKVVEIEFWEYYQTLDEGSSIDLAVKLLREYLVGSDRSVHLIGHGIGGAIALDYTRLYPAKIASLTLLSVAVQPAINWHSYYYARSAEGGHFFHHFHPELISHQIQYFWQKIESKLVLDRLISVEFN